jgi:pimeloyl-ACP methyl ester carboxylesterase
VPLRLAEEMHDRIAGSKLVTFDGGHRFFYTRERDEFAARVAAFVRPAPMSSQTGPGQTG